MVVLPRHVNRLEEPSTYVDYDVDTEHMVNDHYRGEELNAESRRFFGMLNVEKQFLYKCCKD